MIQLVLENEIPSEKSVNYLKGKPRFSWLKNVIKQVHYIEPFNTTRLDILLSRKNEINLSEFQALYDYWNFSNTYSGQFNIANGIDVGRISSYVITWG